MTRGLEGDDLISTLLSNFNRLATGIRDKRPTSFDPFAKCVECGGSVIEDRREALVLCETCGVVAGAAKMSMSFQSRDNYGTSQPIHQYRRLTQFRKVMRQIQGLGGGHIPNFVFGLS